MLLLALGALAFGPVAAQDDEDEAAEDLPTLRLAVLPVLNTLPLYVADELGFYEQAGIDVELVRFNSAREQQIALRAGEVDGANTDMAVLSLLVNGGVDLRAVRHEPIREPYFAIVAGADSGIETVEDLAGVPIAIAENTIIEYLTTTMLENAGVTDTVYEEVPEIPRRLQLLTTGEVAAATLPEPLVTLATELQGATVIVSDATLDFVPTVLALDVSYIDENPEAVAAFLTAYENAVNTINADGEAYRDILIDNINIPEPLQPTYPIPSFPTAQVPTQAETAAVVRWMRDNELIDGEQAYTDLVDPNYLPLPTIAGIVAENEDFTALLEAVSTAGLVETLDSGEFTVFAPPNGALAEVDLSAFTPEELRDLLLYHVVEGEIFAADLLEAEAGTLTTVQGTELEYVVVDGTSVILDGEMTIIDPDIDASNGVVHVIDKVLTPADE